MDSSAIINKLRANGWKLNRIKGSHHYFVKLGCQRPIYVPHPKKDLPIGTMKSIERSMESLK
ncbi:type II toxin-antitoxin system HicA family toxin [uncultured Sutterella sp.]|uniref:type II toxin-antitoxin system HicA family toxin n=1 Tax=uncultured Sutterella sp. TaxID=286133 RepID=UPI0025D47AEC|nr:type II toxin-antitoxin system HicA family toxin [uncultured Sutterella sp.]